jgi:amidase
MAFPLDAAALAELDMVDLGAVRVAVSTDLGGVLVSKSIRATFDDRISRLQRLVGHCDDHPIDLASAPDVDWHLRQDLFVTQYHEQARSWDEGFNPNVRATYEAALATPMADIAAARRLQMQLYQRFAAIFDDYDVLICPGVSIPPFPWRDLNPREIDGAVVTNYMAWLALTSSITVVGHPVVALPCGRDAQGTPFGVQVIGAAYDDRRLLAIARALESACADDPALARPQPDLDRLAGMHSDCRDAGRLVQLAQ